MCIRTIEELEQDTREKQVIDIRDKADFEKETYPDAINIYWEELEEHMNEIRRIVRSTCSVIPGRRARRSRKN